MKNKFRKGVFVVCYIREKDSISFLLLKRKLHWTGWEFPKGGVEAQETEMQAVAREVEEETGNKNFKIVNLNNHGKFNYPKPLADRPGIAGQDYSLFACELKSRKIKLDKREHSSFKFLKFKDAIKLLTWQNQKDCLKIVNSKLSR